MTNFTEVSKNFRLLNPGRLDAFYGPYSSVSSANANVPSAIRKNKVVGVVTDKGTVDYWWKNGISDSNLVIYNEVSIDLFEYKGVYDASTNTPVLTDATGVEGWVYDVIGSGIRNFGSGNITLNPGDQLKHNGIKWVNVPNTNTDLPTPSDETFIII